MFRFLTGWRRPFSGAPTVPQPVPASDPTRKQRHQRRNALQMIASLSRLPGGCGTNPAGDAAVLATLDRVEAVFVQEEATLTPGQVALDQAMIALIDRRRRSGRLTVDTLAGPPVQCDDETALRLLLLLVDAIAEEADNSARAISLRWDVSGTHLTLTLTGARTSPGLAVLARALKAEMTMAPTLCLRLPIGA